MRYRIEDVTAVAGDVRPDDEKEKKKKLRVGME